MPNFDTFLADAYGVAIASISGSGGCRRRVAALACTSAIAVASTIPASVASAIAAAVSTTVAAAVTSTIATSVTSPVTSTVLRDRFRR